MYKIQGKEYQEKKFTVKWYDEACFLMSLINAHMQADTKNELEEVLKYASDFESLTEGVTIKDFAEIIKDEKQAKKINEIIAKNFDKVSNSAKLVKAFKEYDDALRFSKESFLAGNSIVKDKFGQKVMKDNLELLFKTHLDGDIDSINFKTEKEEEIFELIELRTKILDDFFLTSRKYLKESKISPLTSLIFSQTTQMTSHSTSRTQV